MARPAVLVAHGQAQLSPGTGGFRKPSAHRVAKKGRHPPLDSLPSRIVSRLVEPGCCSLRPYGTLLTRFRCLLQRMAPNFQGSIATPKSWYRYRELNPVAKGPAARR